MTVNRIIDSINWDDIRQRLEQSRQAIENLTEPDSLRQEQILRERAVTLAQVASPSASALPVGECIDVLAFRAAGERYAFETVHVAQVYPMPPLTAIPGVPDFVVGIVAVKGNVLSVIDLRSLLDLPLARLEEPSAIIVLQSESMEFGILAEGILGVERYALQALERTLPTLGNIEKTYLKGIAPNRTAILDADRLLSDPRLVVEAA